MVKELSRHLLLRLGIMALVVCSPWVRGLGENECLIAVEAAEPHPADPWAERILGPPDLSIPNHQLAALARYTEWSRAAEAHLLKLKGDPKLKADTYERLLKEVVRRAHLLTENSGDDIKPWDYRRITLDSGVELFVGSKGYFLEIQPDGSCWKGKFPKQTTEGGAIGFLDPRWRPPYSPSGSPFLHEFEKRERRTADGLTPSQ